MAQPRFVCPLSLLGFPVPDLITLLIRPCAGFIHSSSQPLHKQSVRTIPGLKHNRLTLPSLVPALARERPKLTVRAKPEETAASPRTTAHFQEEGRKVFSIIFLHWKAAFTDFIFVHCGLVRGLSHGAALGTCTNTDKKQNQSLS